MRTKLTVLISRLVNTNLMEKAQNFREKNRQMPHLKMENEILKKAHGNTPGVEKTELFRGQSE